MLRVLDCEYRDNASALAQFLGILGLRSRPGSSYRPRGAESGEEVPANLASGRFCSEHSLRKRFELTWLLGNVNQTWFSWSYLADLLVLITVKSRREGNAEKAVSGTAHGGPFSSRASVWQC